MKVITLNKKLFQEKSKELFSNIEGDFDLVIGILNGGGYLLDEFKKQNTNSATLFKTIKIQRESTSKIKENSIVKFILKILPYSILDRLRVNEHKSQKERPFLAPEDYSDNTVSTNLFNIEKSKKINRILILDDALDSGKTMNKVINTCKTICKVADIETAVIAWTNLESLTQPNYYLYKENLLRFPWSLDFKNKNDE